MVASKQRFMPSVITHLIAGAPDQVSDFQWGQLHLAVKQWSLTLTNITNCVMLSTEEIMLSKKLFMWNKSVKLNKNKCVLIVLLFLLYNIIIGTFCDTLQKILHRITNHSLIQIMYIFFIWIYQTNPHKRTLIHRLQYLLCDVRVN